MPVLPPVVPLPAAALLPPDTEADCAPCSVMELRDWEEATALARLTLFAMLLCEALLCDVGLGEEATMEQFDEAEETFCGCSVDGKE